MTEYDKRLKKRLANAQRYITRKANERARHERKSDDVRAVINGSLSHEEFNAKWRNQ